MTTTTTDPVWITEPARQRLQDELAMLEAEPAERRAEARIQELRQLLRRSEVGVKPDDGLVEAGMTVTVHLEGDAASTTFLLAQRDVAGLDPDVELDVYSPTSPLGAAIIGKYPGDAFSYTSPNGRQFRGTVISAVPFGV